MIASKLRDLVFSSLDELKALDPVSINVKKIKSTFWELRDKEKKDGS